MCTNMLQSDVMNGKTGEQEDDTPRWWRILVDNFDVHHIIAHHTINANYKDKTLL